MYAPADNIANFTGVLVQRQYKPGQKYIQLLFETAEGFRLSLSRNLHLVRSLNVGETYEIEGPEYKLGNKTYIHEPIAIPVTPEMSDVGEVAIDPSAIRTPDLTAPKASFLKRYKLLVWVFGLILLTTASGGAAYLTAKLTAKNTLQQTQSSSQSQPAAADPKGAGFTTPSSTTATSDAAAASQATDPSGFTGDQSP